MTAEYITLEDEVWENVNVQIFLKAFYLSNFFEEFSTDTDVSKVKKW